MAQGLQPQEFRSSRRRLFGLAAGLAAGSGSVLAGACGGVNVTPSSGEQAASCRGTLEFISPWNVGSTTGDGLNLLGQDFAATHPGCRAELLFVAGGNDAILEKLVATIAGGAQPPVALVPAQQTPLWIAKGVIQPLDTWAKRDKVTKELFFDGYWPQMVVSGKLWRLPFNIDVNFPWFLNKRTLRAAGQNPEQVPATIDALDALAVRLTRGGSGAHEQLGFVPWQLYGHINSLQSWAYAFGGEFYDPAKDRVIANHPKTVEALEWMVGWAKRLGGFAAVEAELQALGGWNTAFAQGRIAMAAQTSSAVPNLRSINSAVEVAGGLFPAAKGVKPGEATWLSGRGIGVVSGIKDPESAWAFVKWVGADKEGTLSAVNRIAATPGLKGSPGLAVLEKDPELKPFVDALRVAKHNPPGAIMPINVWAGDRGTRVREALEEKRPAREALEEVTRTAQVELDAERARQKQ
ncbi:MAG: extracellular solute-binding protein [Chloroflexi bacterium]|nr:extracellular solute-binding protein [Chloroflexota bacterium]